MYCLNVCLQTEKGVSVNFVIFHPLEGVLPPHQEVHLQTKKGVSVSVVIFHPSGSLSVFTDKEKGVSVSVVIFHLLEGVLLPSQKVCLQTEKGISAVLFHLLEGVLPPSLSGNRNGSQFQCCTLSPTEGVLPRPPSGSLSANRKGSQCQCCNLSPAGMCTASLSGRLSANRKGS